MAIRNRCVMSPANLLLDSKQLIVGGNHVRRPDQYHFRFFEGSYSDGLSLFQGL